VQHRLRHQVTALVTADEPTSHQDDENVAAVLVVHLDGGRTLAM